MQRFSVIFLTDLSIILSVLSGAAAPQRVSDHCFIGEI